MEEQDCDATSGNETDISGDPNPEIVELMAPISTDWGSHKHEKRKRLSMMNDTEVPQKLLLLPLLLHSFLGLRLLYVACCSWCSECG